MTATTAESAPSVTEAIKLSDIIGKPLYVAYQTSIDDIATARVYLVDKNQMNIQFTLKAPSAVLPGEHTGKVKIFVCLDNNCKNQIGNSPQAFSLTYTVKVVAPGLRSLTPTSVAPGSGAFDLTISGTGFLDGSTVYWNGSPRQTTHISTTKLQASITAADVETSGSAEVKVVNPAPYSGTSNVLSFPIRYGTPSIKELLPPTAVAGDSSFTLKVAGNGFGAGSQVLWNGDPLNTQGISGKEVTAQVAASYVASAGKAQVMVKNPLPGSASAPAKFTVEPQSSDAVTEQINANHSAVVHFQTVSFPPGAAWHHALAGYLPYALVADGKVFAATQNPQPQVSAFNQDTGALSWGPIDLPGPSKAAFEGNTVFVLSLASVQAGTLQAFSADTGALQWSTQLPGQWDDYVRGSFGVVSALDGLVYAASSAGKLYAVNEDDGVIAWTANSNRGLGEGSPAVTPYGVFLGCDDYRPDTGDLIWSYSAGCEFGSDMPVVANAKVYVPEKYNNFDGDLFDAQTGKHLGTCAADNSPAIDRNNGYFLRNGALTDIDLASGSTVWSFSGDGDLMTSPVVINQYVVEGASSGKIYALNKTTGNEVWQVDLGNAIPGGGSNEFAPGSLMSAGNGLLVVSAYDSWLPDGGSWLVVYRLANN